MERLVGKYLFDPEISAGKMVFLTGPRQVGKTTFAKNWLSSERVEDTYFDWDDPAVKSEYNRNPLFFRNIVNAQQSNVYCFTSSTLRFLALPSSI